MERLATAMMRESFGRGKQREVAEVERAGRIFAHS
jgi:hypothetical protein